MERSLILAWIVILCTASWCCHCQAYYSDSSPYVEPKQKVTKLHFFLHDTMGGPNPTAVPVVKPNLTTADGKPSTFGEVVVTDDLLTVGPEVTSEVIGNAQGLWVSTDKDALGLTVYMDFGFTVGEYNGSSISVFSRNPISQTQRELAVVGGRGKFRMATGFAEIKTNFLNFTTGDAIVEYNVTVIHY